MAEDGLSQVVSDIAEAVAVDAVDYVLILRCPKGTLGSRIWVPVFFQGDQGTAEDGPSLRCLKLSASMGANDYQCGQCVINLD